MDDRCELIEKPLRSLHVGVHAYECIPGLVFVRVPNERGRYMLVDRCVAEVDCRLCGAIAGEPCHNRKRDRKYHIMTHAVRREDWKKQGKGRHARPKPKIHIAVEDYLGAYAEPPTEES